MAITMNPKDLVKDNCLELACGHIFVLITRQGFPIGILNALKLVPEVCSIYYATVNLSRSLGPNPIRPGILGL